MPLFAFVRGAGSVMMKAVAREAVDDTRNSAARIFSTGWFFATM